MSISMCFHVLRAVQGRFINELIMLKGKCKKWEQKYEIVYERPCLSTFFGEMNPTNFAAKKLAVMSMLAGSVFLYVF